MLTWSFGSDAGQGQVRLGQLWLGCGCGSEVKLRKSRGSDLQVARLPIAWLQSFIAEADQLTQPELYHFLDSSEFPCEHILQSRCSETTTTTIQSHCEPSAEALFLEPQLPEEC